VASKSPVLVSQMQGALRRFTLLAAQGIYAGDSEGYDYIYTINRKIKYLKGTYFPVIYPFHSPDSKGFDTIHPVDNGKVIDDLKNLNYYQTMRKIYTEAIKFVDECKY